MSSVECLREFVKERLTAAVDEVFGVLSKTIVEYEEEIDRQRILLDAVWKPDVKLRRIELQQPSVCEEEVLADQQLCIQERNPSLDQEDPDPKTIAENVLDRQRLVLDRQRKLLDVVWKPDIKLHRIVPPELPQKHVCEEEVLTEQQLCVQERNSSLDQEDPEPSQVKEEQQEPCTSQIVLKQETDAFMLTPTYEESDPSEDQTLNPVETLSAAEKETVVNMPVILSVVSVAHSDHQLLSQHSHVAESEDQKEDEHEDSGSTRNAEQKPKRTRQKSGGDINTHKKSKNHHKTRSAKKDIRCDTCGRFCTQNSTLRIRTRTHTGEKPHSCRSCGKDFGGKSLFVHKRSHTDVTPYSCKTCEKKFSRKDGLKRHMLIHKRPYSCNTCQKKFSRKYGLKRHMLIHKRPYSCNTCQKKFSRKYGLERHIRIHTGEKPYSCETCGKDFRQECHLKIHKGEKLYSCKACGKGFQRRSNLSVHMTKYHNVGNTPVQEPKDSLDCVN